MARAAAAAAAAEEAAAGPARGGREGEREGAGAGERHVEQRRAAPADSFPLIDVVREPHAAVKKRYLALSADVYLLPEAAERPLGLHAFAGARRLQLERLRDGSTMEQLDQAVAPVDGYGGPALRVAGVTRSRRVHGGLADAAYVLVAPSVRLRDQWLGCLRLRLAPCAMLQREVLAAVGRPAAAPPEAERSGAAAEAESQTPLLAALSESLPRDDLASALARQAADGAAADGADARGKRERAAEWTADSIADVASAACGFGGWFGAFSSAVAALHNTAEPLAKTLGAFALIGPVIGVVAVAAHAADMLCRMRTSQHDLADAHLRLRFISRRLCHEVLFILQAGLDDAEFVSDLFTAVEQCWACMAGIERHLLDRRRERFRAVDRVASLLRDVSEMERLLREVRQLGRSVEIDVAWRTDVEGLRERVETLHDVSQRRHFCVSYLTVPDLPQHMCREAVRNWGALRAAVTSGGRGGRRVAKVAATGPGGTGKTVACKCIANWFAYEDEDSFFHDGVAYLELGPDATPGDVCSGLARLCEVSGGRAEGSAIRFAMTPRDDVDTAVTIAKEWLDGRKMLLVVDGGWIRPSRPGAAAVAPQREWADALSGVLTGPGSCLLFTTRFDVLSEDSGCTVRFGPLDVDGSAADRRAAIAMFDLYCDIDARDGRYDEDGRDAVLRFTGGLPIVVANSGAYVRRMQYRWDEVLATLERDFYYFSSASTEGMSLARFMNLGLLDLDAHRSSSAAFLSEGEVEILRGAFGRPRHCFSALYASLVALARSRPCAPLHIVASLWGVSVPLAQRVAALFESFQLLRLDACAFVDDAPPFESAGRGSPKMVVLHDLQYIHAEHVCASLPAEAGRTLSAAHFHRRMLSHYCAEYLGAALRPGVEWGRVMPSSSAGTASTDWYMVEHLKRHMEASIPADGPLMTECLAALCEPPDDPSAQLAMLETLLSEKTTLRDQYQELHDAGLLTDEDRERIAALDLEVAGV